MKGSWLALRPDYEVGRTWAYVLNGEKGLDMSQSVSTNVACSDRDLYVQLDMDGNGTTDVLTIVGVDEAGQPLKVDEWGDYQRIVFDFKGNSATLEPTGLPVDRFQRIRSGYNVGQKASGILIDGHQLGVDRVLDVNGDGLPDIIRMELASGDTEAQLPWMWEFGGSE